MESTIDWLNQQPEWVSYRTKIDLEEKSPDEQDLKSIYKKLVNHTLTSSLFKEFDLWPGQPMKRHNDAKLLYHKLVFLADIGVKAGNNNISKLIDKIISNASEEGPFQILGNMPNVFGGSGKDEFMWLLCDSPLISYALIKMGAGDEPAVKKSVDYLLSSNKDFGWPCAATKSLGEKFKGPGKKTDPCPYANLLMLKLISSIPELKNSKEAKKGCEVLLDLWENRKNIKYFLFGMGTDFSKLKAPFIWFDILHVLDVLSEFEFIYNDPRMVEMVDLLKTKPNENGLYMAESVYRAWKNWDFGQKKQPSGWITFLVYRIYKKLKTQ
ncbi:hypothetical protein GF376_03730 [Candidatus Peregrinibacteria bacterium]|nr:hypothetical protein [Candidatus Peregrinibacteria bacterium]